MLFPTRRLCSFISRFFLLLAFLSACLFLLYGVNKHFSRQPNVRHIVGDDHDHHHHHEHPTQQKESIVVRETNEHRLTLEKRRLLQKNDSSSSSSSGDEPEVKIGNRPISLYVHFDLKGAAPKVSYFEQLFPLLRKWGAHGICMEYEDMFPFDGILEKVKHQQAYTKDEINRINQLAEENHLDVMPLLQTYGHLEFVLKLKEFSELRENAKYPQVITPCVNQTYVVLFAMIDQYLQLHPNIRWFHIGHDEVYYFLGHPSCEEFRRATGIQSQYDLFAHHLGIITNYIKEKYPKVSLFVWHDVLQNLNVQTLQKHNLMTRVNPVLWSYREEMSVEGFVVGPQAAVFGQFKSLWGATAFKGAAHEVATISDVKHYYQNQVSWIQQLNSYIPTKWQNFDGMIITGWSRYDHFLSLCELLPYAIPSLVFSLTAWKEPYKSQDKVDIYTNQPLQKYVQGLLQCSAPLHLNIQEHTMKPIPKCRFPGASIYESLVGLPSVWAQVEQSEAFVDKFVTDLHVKYEYIHVKRGEECLEKLRPTLSLLNQFIETFRKAMDEVFPAQVAIEWLETYFMKRYRAVKKRHDFIQRAVTEQKTWLPRPIPNLDKLELD